MNDSFLMKNISKGVSELCKKSNLKSVSLVDICVGYSSKITEKTLLNSLLELNSDVVDKNTKVKVSYEDMPELMAVIKNVEGEKKDI